VGRLGESGEADAQGVAASLATLSVEQHVTGDPEDPRAGVTLVLGHVVEAAPDHEEGLSDHVLGALGPRATLDESQEIGIGGPVQRSEGVLPVDLRAMTHILYLSTTGTSVSSRPLRVVPVVVLDHRACLKCPVTPTPPLPSTCATPLAGSGLGAASVARPPDGVIW